MKNRGTTALLCPLKLYGLLRHTTESEIIAGILSLKGGVTMYILTSKRCLICSSDHILFACRLVAPRAVRLV